MYALGHVHRVSFFSKYKEKKKRNKLTNTKSKMDEQYCLICNEDAEVHSIACDVCDNWYDETLQWTCPTCLQANTSNTS